MSLTLGNPLGGVAAGAVSFNQFAIKNAGRSLSTGRTADNDVVSDFLGKGLSDKYFILSKININMGYSKNALKVASSALDSIAKTLADMLAVVAQSTSGTNLDTLNDILRQKLNQVELQTKAATFDNRQLLTGDLGQDSTVRTSFVNKAVSIKAPLAAGNFLGLGVAAAATQGIYRGTVVNTIATDTFTVNGVTITAAAAQSTNPAAPTYLTTAAAGTDTLAAASIVAVLNSLKTNGTNAQQIALANYTFSNAAGVVSATQVVGQDDGGGTPLASTGGTIALAINTAGVTAAGTNVQDTITVGNVVAGDAINIQGVTFTAVAGEPTKDNQFKIGISANDSAGNLAKAIQISKSETLQAFTTSTAANVITITRVSQGTEAINTITTSASLIGQNSVKGAGSGIDLSGIKTLDGFIGVSTKPIFTLDQYQLGNTAKALAASFGNVAAQATLPAVNAGDAAAVYSTVIGGRKFTGAFYEANGVANLANLHLKMIDSDSGEYFTITAAAGAGDITTAANAGTVLTNINTLFSNVNFNETKTLDVNTDLGDILVNNVPIASTKGTVVKLQAGDFTNLQFKDFLIEPGSAVGNVKFTAVITDKDGNDQSYTNDVAAATIPLMIEGYKLDLTDSTGGTNNVLSINVGDRGITSLNLAANYAAVAQAYKDMLLSTGDGLDVRVGLNFDDTLKATIKDISAPRLYLDQNGIYQANLDLSTDAGQKVAQTVITNALATVRAEQSRVTSQMESIQEASDALSITIQVTKEASDGYLNTDLIEAAQAFSEAVKRTIAAISTLEAGNKVSDAAQRVIQSIA